MYTQCWSRIESLGAGLAILQQYRKLTTDDVKASTAIVNPNELGSTQLKLSWIWQTARGHSWGLASGTDIHADDINVLECKFIVYSL